MRRFAALVFPLACIAATDGYATDGYIGSRACFGCHAAVYRSFAKTGMGQSMRLAGDLTPPALAAETSVPIPDTARVLRVFRDKEGWQQSEAETDVFQTQHKLDYAVGSGVNGFTFLVRRGSYLFQAPLSFYSRAAKWDLSPGYKKLDLGFSRVVPQECIGCHAGRANLVANRPGQYEDPPFSELAIGCENCHGPGEAHVKSAGKTAGTIVNPAKLAPQLAENICVNCHQTGDARVLQPGKRYQDFRPGQWLFDTAVILKASRQPDERQQSDLLEHYTAMQASRCFRESAGKLSCLSCHDPHVQPSQAQAPAYFRAKCLTCHSETSCPLPLKTRSAQTPADDCAGCHMPKRSTSQISHSALTNHRIPAREGELVPDAPLTELDGFIVVNPPAARPPRLSAAVRLKAYGDLAYRDSHYQQLYAEALDQLARTDPPDPFVQASLGHKALADGRFEEAVQHLTKALPLAEGPIYLDLATALSPKRGQTGLSPSELNRENESIEYLKKGVEIDPYNPIMQKTLILRYIDSRRFAEARQNMEHYVELFPEDSFMRGLLARVK